MPSARSHTVRYGITLVNSQCAELLHTFANTSNILLLRIHERNERFVGATESN
jgi:hypothetical protein